MSRLILEKHSGTSVVNNFLEAQFRSRIMLRQLATSLCIFASFGVTSAYAQSAKDRPSVPTEFRNQVQNTYIVTFNQQASQAFVSASAAQVASESNGQVNFIYNRVLNGFSITLPAAAAGRLISLPNVQRVEKDQVAYALHHREGHGGDGGGGGGGGGGDKPNKGKKGGNSGSEDPVVEEPVETFQCPTGTGSGEKDWGVSRVEGGSGGLGVDVYIIDTGIDRDHPDLCMNLASDLSSHFSATNCSGSGCLTAWDDDNGHGTHVAGTVAANNGMIGVAPEATLHAVKVLSGSGSGSYSGVIAGIDFVAAQAVQLDKPIVANMSLGGGYSASLNAAVANARDAGVLFAVAAGNEGTDAQTKSPASAADAITVSATSSSCTWAYWSNWGDGDSSGPAPEPVDIAAPGVSIKSTWNDGGYRTISGTSMASPHVAGALALWLEGSPADTDNDGDLFDEAMSALKAADVLSDGTCDYVGGSQHQERFLKVDPDW
jgi:subtilisin